MTVRLLTVDDRAQAKALWQSTFDDSPAFVNWFFDNRYLPQWSAGVFEGGDLLSVIHGTPMNLSLGDISFPALMTSGVATVPHARGKGYMFTAMRFLQKHVRDQNMHALFNHPQRPGAYAHLGFRPSTFTRYWNGGGTFPTGEIRSFSEDEAYRVYSALADRYTAFACRDRQAFHLKMADYGSDGAKGFLLREAGKTIGYCIYFETEAVCGEEVLSLGAYGPILQELKRVAGKKGVRAKLPPDVPVEGDILPQNVMLASEEIWRTLKAVNRPCFCVDEY